MDFTKKLLAFCLSLLMCAMSLAQQPVITAHPRIFLDAPTKSFLLAKKNQNDADWLALKDEADDYAQRGVLAWNPTNAGVWNTNYIFYNYCGSSWEDAAFCLGMTHQLTKTNNAGANPTVYSNKLMEFADSIIAGYAAYPPCSGCPNMFQWNSSYATRHVGGTIAVIYDWCYDELGATRKAALLNLIEDWFAYMRVPYNVYQNTVNPTGNYYFGHVLCSAYLGYATFYDSPQSQEMIDFARQRVLGTQSGSLQPSDLTRNFLKETFTGNLPTAASSSYLGPAAYTTAPQKEGIPVQGWGYGGGNIKRLIDYCFMVKSATGEPIADSLETYLSKTSEAFTHALTPNRFQIDNSNDWGSFVGNLLGNNLPLRLAAVLEGKPQGVHAEYFYRNWIKPVSLAATWNHGYPELNWEKMLYKNPNRPAVSFKYPLYYPAITQNTWASVPIDQTLPKYYMRSSWDSTATWCALNMSNAFYDDHDHHNAGHFQIVRGDANDGDDLLLVGTNEVGNGGAFGLNGIEGGTSYHLAGSFSNTLYFDDFHDYVEPNNSGYTVGGQSFYGYDEPTNVEQNEAFSYIRADLTSAYYRKGEVADTANRTLKHFYRSFLYLRDADVFLVYDKILAKNSNNAQGQYKKHLRWHFPENPTINGNDITAIKDNSVLYVHTVIPANVSINKVDESNNPDNIFGSSLNYAFNTYTWRAEVNAPANPLQQTFLTILQPAAVNAAEMTTASLTTITGNMEGSSFLVNGKKQVVLFSKQEEKYLLPIANTAYTFLGDTSVTHTLCGMIPNGNYYIAYSGGTISIDASPTGNYTASPSGVLRFKLSINTSLLPATLSPAVDLQVSPNPSQGKITCTWENTSREALSIEVVNLLGQVVSTQSLDKQQFQTVINLEKAGVYMIRLKNETSILAVQKVVIVK